MKENSRKWIVGLTIIASIITIFSFVTGIASLPPFLTNFFGNSGERLESKQDQSSGTESDKKKQNRPLQSQNKPKESVQSIPQHPMSIQKDILLDEFDSFVGWTYSFESNRDAFFKANGGVLSVADFGKQQGGSGNRGSWYGPIATKELTETVDINREDFMIKAYLSSQDNLEGALGFIWIALLDKENTPLVGIYWSDNWHEGNGIWSYEVGDPSGNDRFGHNNFLGIYTNDGNRGVGRHGGFQTINGKVILKKSSGQLALLFNKDEGTPLLTSPTGAHGVASKLKIYILKYGEFTARDMRIDYLKVSKN